MKTLTETEKEIIKGAVEIIKTPGKWTNWVGARNEYGVEVENLSPDACKWCAWGAMVKIAGNDEAVAPINREFLYKFHTSVSVVNDEHGRKAVIEKLQELINGDGLPVNPCQFSVKT